MAQILIGGSTYQIPDRLPNKPRKLVKQPHTESGLSLFQFLTELFEANETRTEKLTDPQLEHLVRSAFADSSRVLTSLDNSVGSRICKWRWLYNSGKMSNDETPDICSFRYNDEGQPVQGKAKLKPLTLAEQASIAAKYGIADKRFKRRGKK